ncbi:outer membrane beta-barrel family protein [Hymenobacter ginsengisoli]|uniref:Outer membrane beta-barrel family protein n=2 Tax=Hymenobacter TaxID=89966 RepID=A0ABP8QS13_9BACT|nr:MULTISPECIES: TonB-dependent receptor [unclassified Hymenobacter]MBO2033436.1 TonB-dependent receptor [Hymenobacter sp. BT559]
MACFLLLSWAVGGTLSAFGQGTALVTGTVRDPAGLPVEFATITLHRVTDSTVTKSEFSDAKGTFLLGAPAGGRYLVSVAQVGYERYWSAPFELPPTGLVLPVVGLRTSAATALQEVKVVGQKPLFEHQADRTIVNVENSPLAAGNTALDVLTRAPGVTVDGSDNLALRGRQGLLVIIDGKRQPMTGTELADYLRTLPAEQLATIELITNPPASYDAQGTAGVIAINLKKDQRQGANSSLNLGYGRGVYGRFTTGATGNYRRGKINAYGAYTYAARSTYLRLTSHRVFYDQGQPTGGSDQEDFTATRTQAHNWKAGVDYAFTRRTTLGAALTGQLAQSNGAGTNAVTLLDASGSLSRALTSPSYRNASTPNLTANLNLRHAFADSSNSRVLTADANYATYRLGRQQGLAALLDAGSVAPTLLSSDQSGNLRLLTAQLDYVQPLAHQQRLSGGLKISQVQSVNDAVFQQTSNGLTTLDTAQTNQFRYTENIRAAYLNWQQTGARATWQAGLRAEQTSAQGVQEVGNQRFDRQYVQLFPSASLKYTFSPRHELTVALSRRLDRPGYDQLNPFRIYLNATTYRSGNSALLPQTSYNAEVTHTYLQKYTVGLSYSNTQHPILIVVQPATATSRFVLARPVNLGAQHYAALTLTVPLTPSKAWSIYNSAVFYYSRFTGDLAGTTLNRAKPSINLSSTHTLALGQGWSVDLSATYQSPEIYGFITSRANGDLTIGAQKSLLKGQGTLKFNVTDVLYTNRNIAASTYDNYVDNFTQSRDSRVATLSFSYRLGSNQLAASRRADGAEEEKRRVGGQ